MPLVRIDVPTGTTADHRARIAEVVYRALVDVAGAPEHDRFVVVSEHAAENLLIDPHYFVDRTDRALIVQITLNGGRTLEIKKALYRAIADGLHDAVALRTEDVMISLVEVPKENWSFGGGVAQYAE
ncbi:tautomerase family protein [Frondihabitans cladoniiphilus]|uniref:Tautomerase family protein n=1 Tax=Frondihabitans cladoniiphilus TaxID=715785 RepID=A0ABP8W1R3_9MICO